MNKCQLDLLFLGYFSENSSKTQAPAAAYASRTFPEISNRFFVSTKIERSGS
ncbi:hypothetical protein FHS90_001610 [Rufibacter quisquiliarum]|uniref:Uncharacterized protein n=1 Tax=Rufibacter quisquiliarum TaxID=1549639 RepID=A0A839GDB6_9BACT|nr:hypothetical protein [Rufibacter quisquiliarum]